MSCYLRQTRLARQQLYEQAQYIHDQGQPDAAYRLIERYLDVCAALTQWPNMGHLFESEHDRLKNIRTVKVPGYPSLIYYRVLADQVTVIAVLHGSLAMENMEQQLERGDAE